MSAPPPPPPVNPLRDMKERAEIAKLEAEAESARREAEAHAEDAALKRATREKTDAETYSQQIQNRIGRILAEAQERAERDELAKNKYHHLYVLSGTVNAASVSACISQLNAWARNEPGCPVELVLNSPGGSIVDGFALWDFLKQMQASGHHVTTSTIGYAASMAGILLQAGDVRVMGRQAWLLIHQAQFGAAGSYGEVEDQVNWVKRIQDRILDIFAERSNMARSEIKRRWARTDWWISSDDALKWGFVDEVR